MSIFSVKASLLIILYTAFLVSKSNGLSNFHDRDDFNDDEPIEVGEKIHPNEKLRDPRCKHSEYFYFDILYSCLLSSLI